MTPPSHFIITLDDHTRHFFKPDRIYQSAPAQAFFRINAPGFEGRTFAGRLVPLSAPWRAHLDPLDFEWRRARNQLRWSWWVPVVQEVQTIGQELIPKGRACFVDFLMADEEYGEAPSQQQIRAYWQRAVKPRPDYSTGTVLPHLSWEHSLSRCHFDHLSNVGLLVSSDSDTRLRKLNAPPGESEPEYLAVDLGLEWLELTPQELDADDGCRALVDLSCERFHELVGAMLRDPTVDVHHLVRLSSQSEEENGCEVLNCTGTVRRLAQKRFEVEFLEEMREGGALEGAISAAWMPWIVSGIKVTLPNGERESIPMPTVLKERCDAIRLQLNCNLPLRSPEATPHADPVHRVHWHWATNFVCQVEGGSGHDVFVSMSKLLEDIESLEAEIASVPTEAIPEVNGESSEQQPDAPIFHITPSKKPSTQP